MECLGYKNQGFRRLEEDACMMQTVENPVEHKEI